MELTRIDAGDASLIAGYICSCGCTPTLAYSRGGGIVEESCCCGNHFAIGPDAAASLSPRVGFVPEFQGFDAPWGERLEAAWLLGPGVHPPEGEQGEHHGRTHSPAATEPSR